MDALTATSTTEESLFDNPLCSRFIQNLNHLDNLIFAIFNTENYYSHCGNFSIFSVIQILREINSGGSRSFRMVVFAILGALDFANLVISAFKKCKNS